MALRLAAEEHSEVQQVATQKVSHALREKEQLALVLVLVLVALVVEAEPDQQPVLLALAALEAVEPMLVLQLELVLAQVLAAVAEQGPVQKTDRRAERVPGQDQTPKHLHPIGLVAYQVASDLP
jgi:hypothetical protein